MEEPQGGCRGWVSDECLAEVTAAALQGLLEENGRENVGFISYSREITVARGTWVQNNVNQRLKLDN